MSRNIWKWSLGISLVFLVLLILFAVGIWALGNATAAMLGGIMGSVDPDNFGYRYYPLDEFLVNSVGSPMFYICVADIAALIASVVMLIVTKKPTSTHS